MAIITMFGTDGDDTLAGANGNSYRFKGFAGNDTLTGADGNDEFHGGAGVDVMSGGAGDDVFIYNDGDTPVDDVLDGGDGFDTISFYSAAGTNPFLHLTEAMRTNIEELLGGDGDDFFTAYSLTSGITLSGGAGNDVLESGSGNDTLIGGDGNDTLKGNGGDDGMFGGAGHDYFLYWIDQTYVGDFISGGDGYDVVDFRSEAGTTRAVTLDASFSSIEYVYGGDGDDSIDASGTTDGIVLDSGNGNDVLTGGAGNDTLIGGAGNDVLSGGDGNDTIYYRLAGDTPVGDTIDGGDGFDAIRFNTSAGADLFLTLTDAMRTNIEQVSGGEGNELFSGYGLTSGITLSGGGGNNGLEGGSGNDILIGGDGTDTLKGNGGDDDMFGDGGDDWFLYWIDQTYVGDFISGGGGFDTVDFRSEAGTARAVTLDSSFSSIERVLGGDGDDSIDASGTLDGIVLDSGNGNDVLTGGAGNDTLSGGVGNDVLSGGNGDDTIYYYLTGDTPVGDTIDGGAGFDAISFYTATGTNLSLTLTDAMRTNIEQVSGGDGNELFSGYGLTSGITLSGGNGNNGLEGGSGNDILIGGNDTDTLKGNGGDDVMHGGAGDDWFLYWIDQTYAGDFIDGGDGFDTVDFRSEAGTARAVTVDTSFSSIERLFGGDGDDSFDASSATDGIILEGGNGSDVLVGGAGADTLVGGAGNDILKGNSGYDTLIGGTGDDIFVTQGSGGTWTVTDFVQGQDHIQIVSETPLDFAWVQAHAVQVGNDTHISIDGSELILQQIGVANLQASDFIF